MPAYFCTTCGKVHEVQRPQAAPRRRGLSGQEWREIGYALLVWALCLFAILWALPAWAYSVQR